MKKLFFVPIILALVIFNSCDDDNGYVSMSAVESAVWIEINEFRTDSGKAEVTPNYDTMVEQAKIFSNLMATGAEDVSTEGLVPIWNTIHDRWGGTNDVSIVTKVTKGTADISVEDLIDPVKMNPNTGALLLSDVSIGGVGIDYDADGNAYMTILMMLVNSSN